MFLFIIQLIIGSIVCILLAMVVLLPYMVLRWTMRRLLYSVWGIDTYTMKEKKLMGIFKKTDDPCYYLDGSYRRDQEALLAATVEDTRVEVIEDTGIEVSREEFEEYKKSQEAIKKSRSLRVAALNAPPKGRKLW